ncbi:MAG: hypothetical protein ACQEQ0_08800 [Bacteroidota bacterium]
MSGATSFPDKKMFRSSVVESVVSSKLKARSSKLERKVALLCDITKEPTKLVKHHILNNLGFLLDKKKLEVRSWKFLFVLNGVKQAFPATGLLLLFFQKRPVWGCKD